MPSSSSATAWHNATAQADAVCAPGALYLLLSQARTLIPCHLIFEGHDSISVLSSRGGPFSGCTSLNFAGRTAADMHAMTQVALHASQHYTNLTSAWLRCIPSSQDAAAQELLG
jgi:hypothetical protein